MTSKGGNVSVTASEVEDNRITIGDFSVNDSYSFGPSTGTSGDLISASSNSEEDLSASFTFTVSSGVVFSSLSKSYDITLSLKSDKTYGEDEGDALAYATGTTVTGTNENVKGTYLAAPTSDLIGTGITIATVTSSGVAANNNYSSTSGNLQVSVTKTDDTSATVSVTATFGWGTYFNKQNPVNLNDADYLDDYVAGLTWLNTYLNGATFIYTVGGTAQSTEGGGD